MYHLIKEKHGIKLEKLAPNYYCLTVPNSTIYLEKHAYYYDNESDALLDFNYLVKQADYEIETCK